MTTTTCCAFSKSERRDGILINGDTGAQQAIASAGAPSPRFDALVRTLGDEVFVYGGNTNPHWGFGAEQTSDQLRRDGAIYSSRHASWRPISVPDGLILQANQDDPNSDRGAANLTELVDLGTRALATLDVLDRDGMRSRVRYLYDREHDAWQRLDAALDTAVLPMRNGALLLLAADYTHAVVLDPQHNTQRTLQLKPPAQLHDASLSGPVVRAWDGCRLYVYGYARVSYETVQNGCGANGPMRGPICDPVSPVAHITQQPGGATFNVGD